MGNKLRDIFSSDFPELTSTISFSDATKKQEFENALKKAYETGEAVVLGDDVVSRINTRMKTKTGERLLDEQDNISHFTVAPSREPAPITVETDYGKYTFKFIRTYLKDKVILANDKNHIVYIIATFNTNNESKGITINLTYTTNPERATSVLDIAKTYNAVTKFLNQYLGAEASDNSDMQKSLSFFRRTELMCLQMHEIEKLYKHSFPPAKITKLNTQMYRSIKILNLFLVKHLPIKQNLDDFTLTFKKSLSAENYNGLKIGSKNAFSLTSQEEFNILGKSLKVYLTSIIYNAEISSITEDDNGNYDVICTGTDAEPMFKVALGFLTKAEASEALKCYNEGRLNDLLLAKSYEELLSDEADKL